MMRNPSSADEKFSMLPSIVNHFLRDLEGYVRDEPEGIDAFPDGLTPESIRASLLELQTRAAEIMALLDERG